MTNESSTVQGLPEHAKAVEQIVRLTDRLGELRRHL